MKMSLVSAVALGLILSGAAFADDKIVKIGVLNDQSGLYADAGGPGSVLAAQMAVEDSGLAAKGWTIDVIARRPLKQARRRRRHRAQWFDEDKVDVDRRRAQFRRRARRRGVVKEKNGVFLNSGAATSDLTGKACTPNTIHWTYDTYALANGTGKAVVKAGGDTWFFLTADYAFGHALQRDTSAVVEANGGKVRRQRQRAAQHARLLLLPAAGAGLEGQGHRPRQRRRRHDNAIKQAHEFGIVAGGQKLAALLLFITDVNALGLDVAQGLQFTETFYWDLNDGTRAFSKRFAERMKNHAMPTDDSGGRLRRDAALSQGARGDGRQSA